MSRAEMRLPQLRPLGGTLRRDAWWLQPGLTFLGLMTFIVYSTWAAHQGTHYWLESVLLAGAGRLLAARDLRAAPGLAAQDLAVFPPVLAGAADPVGAGRLPIHVLLLPGRVLQGLLGRPPELLGG